MCASHPPRAISEILTHALPPQAQARAQQSHVWIWGLRSGDIKGTADWPTNLVGGGLCALPQSASPVSQLLLSHCVDEPDEVDLGEEGSLGSQFRVQPSTAVGTQGSWLYSIHREATER